MRQILRALFSLIVLFSQGTIMGQDTVGTCSISKRIHMPKGGDSYDKLGIEPVDPGASGNNTVWDFAHVVAAGTTSHVSYVSLGDSVLVKIEGGTQHTYKIEGDSMMLTIRETSLSMMRASVPPLCMIYPLTYGDSIVSRTYINGSYCDNNGVAEAGTLAVKADGWGTLILPDDTLHDVLRIHTRETSRVWVAESCSMQPIRESDDSLMVKTYDVWQWYSPSYRYPLAEVMVTSIQTGDSAMTESATAFLCPPPMQEYVISTVSKPTRDSGSASQESSGNLDGESIVTGLSFAIGREEARVTFIPTAEAEAQLVLSDILGRVYSAMTRRKAYAGLEFSDRVDTSQLPSGDYVLRLQVGEEILLERFTIK